SNHKFMLASDALTLLESDQQSDDFVTVITIDDAFSSLYEVAWPIFQARNIPITVFVSTRPIDNQFPGYMYWQQLSELRDAGAEIGSQTISHPHLPLLGTEDQRHELLRSRTRLQEMTGGEINLLAYPYGEASQAIFDLAQAAGYNAAFGQHSGGLNAQSLRSYSRHYLPRFPVNETYGDMDVFPVRARASGLALQGFSPADPLITDTGAHVLRFSLPENHTDTRRLACYFSSIGQVPITYDDAKRGTIALGPEMPLGRSRLNCTWPRTKKQWSWFGYQFYRIPQN
ncbi:MAG: polysaccharide deacetylase family protein, partial [Pseudomonadota bacterium]